ncbi:hypothetical protein [Prauserella muralis]|uniref:Uncharacterized protein n=1 Tax=Prauserella muralis TaxID=588067 RepID=A0A2V4AJG8_9PSEU|nr:hypothetical protein [Prauserella muralis]PXY19760.1 hypothetical protein BAY60_33245 [Prauserella muralis]TWE29585.1 hypothetical protein FHX69_2272 [Prauserella muralis]
MSDEKDTGTTVSDELAADVDEAVGRAVKTVELGRRGFTISVAVFALVVGLVLPWVGEAAGWQVLAGEGGAIPRLFATTSTVFGVLASALALATRRWWLAWVCAVGGCIASVDGLLAIWSQQSSAASGAPGDGPGLGMVIAVLGMVVLAAQWMRVAWSRN